MSIYDIPRMSDEEITEYVNNSLSNRVGEVYERPIFCLLNDNFAYENYVEDAEGYVDYGFSNGANWYADENVDELSHTMYTTGTWIHHFAESEKRIPTYETVS